MDATTGTRLPPLLLLLLLLLLLPLGILSIAADGSAHPGYPETVECGGERDLAVVRREEYEDGRILDITHFYREDMPSWESDEGLGHFLRLAGSMKNGSLANNSEMKLPAHAGTHVDAPGHVYQHYFEAGFDVDTLDLHVLNGPALLVDVPRDKNLTAEVMMSLNIPKGVRRVLFRTLNTDRQLMWKKACDTSYVGFMKDGAQWLVDNTDIKLVGIDYLSVAAYDRFENTTCSRQNNEEFQRDRSPRRRGDLKPRSECAHRLLISMQRTPKVFCFLITFIGPSCELEF